MMKKILLVILILAIIIPSIHAFGAGNIPSYAAVEGQAFRHGDITDAIGELYKKAGSGILGGLTKSKFSSLDVKRVYFGNFLRDYSQAMDTAALSKLDKQSILNIVMVLSFLGFGYATDEFEVTDERLGVYLPIEHIDNPKGYAEGEDARRYDSRLRPPVDSRELEIDPRTGMKNYIGNESGHWDTSTALVRQRLLECIEKGRQYRRTKNNKDEYEAFRLLGCGLHTLEDFPAHSNFAEIYLQKLGYKKVFAHVGDNVRIRAPDGQMVPPIVTGTFGGMDFVASVLGEAGDHLSSASVSDLDDEIKRSQTSSRSGNKSSVDNLRDLIIQLDGYSSKVTSFRSGSGGSGSRSLNRDLDDINNLRSTSRDPNQMSPQELHATLWKILTFRDRISKTIEATIDKIPGLNALVEKISNSIAVFVYSTVEPFVKPLVEQAKEVIGKGSSQIMQRADQLEVFDNPNASDPTHSMLSKDHFSEEDVLNNPCGNLARIITIYSVKQIVEAWGNDSNPHKVIDDILQCLHHPYFADERHSKIQSEMGDFMRQWVKTQGRDIEKIVRGLTKENLRNSASKIHAHVHSVNDPSLQTQQGYNELTAGGLWGLHNTGVGARKHDTNSISDSLSNLGLGGNNNSNNYNKPVHSSHSPYQSQSHSQTHHSPYQSHSHSQTHHSPYQSHSRPQPLHHSSGMSFPQANTPNIGDYEMPGGYSKHVSKAPTPPNIPYQPYPHASPPMMGGHMPSPMMPMGPSPMGPSPMGPSPMGPSPMGPSPMGMPMAESPVGSIPTPPSTMSPPSMPSFSPYDSYPPNHGPYHTHNHHGYPGQRW